MVHKAVRCSDVWQTREQRRCCRLYIADACASGRPVQLQYAMHSVRKWGRRPILPTTACWWIQCIKRRRDSSSSPHFLPLTLPFLSQNSLFSQVFSTVTFCLNSNFLNFCLKSNCPQTQTDLIVLGVHCMYRMVHTEFCSATDWFYGFITKWCLEVFVVAELHHFMSIVNLTRLHI